MDSNTNAVASLLLLTALIAARSGVRRVKAGKRADWNRPVSTPEMAKKAAKGLALGLSPTRALREAGYPPATVNRSRAGINKMIRAELGKLGRKYIELGRDLSRKIRKRWSGGD